MRTRVARATGTAVELWRDADGSEYGEAGWWIICTPHGELTVHDTRHVAQAHAVRPDEWCDGCREAAGA